MRCRIAGGGVERIDRWGRFVRFPWRFWSPLVLTPVLFAGCMLLAINRNLNLAWLLKNSPQEAQFLIGEFGRTSVENLLVVEPAPAHSMLPTLQLYVPKNTLDQMHDAIVTGDPALGHEAGGNQPYYRAYFRDESGRLQKARICYRGLMNYHHWPEKPSLRVRIKKSEIARGQRYVELTRPKDILALRNQLPEVLAEQLGIVTTRNEQVRLFVNNRYFGVYLRSYRPGESLALANGRMPGTFFKGDLVGDDGIHDHLDLWSDAANWKTTGEAAPGDVALFEDFLAALRAPVSADSLTRLAELLDTECLARWSAIMVATGCVHTDARHNQTYFFCSNQGKFEIMPWDPTLYEVPDRPFTPVDVVNHPVLEVMTCDPRWVHRRNALLYDLVCGAASAHAVARYVDETAERILPDLRADVNIGKKQTIGRGRVPSSILEIDDEIALIKKWAVRKEGFLRKYLSDACVVIESADRRTGTTIVSVSGTVAIDVTAEGGQPPEIRDNSGGIVDRLYPGLSQDVHTAAFQPHDVAKELPCVVPVALRYRIAATPEALRFSNAITGESVSLLSGQSIARGKPRTILPALLRQARSRDITLGPGVVTLSEDLRINPQSVLRIAPGTTLRLAPHAGIYARGKVLAMGTADAPILLEAAGDSPWAAVGLSGPQTAGSRFEHVHVAGGSIGSDRGIRFKGMFNAYNCPEIHLRDCHFSRNETGDDAVNLAESQILVERCSFSEARSDALDLDMCRGRVADCTWRDSGNDGLDLMSCTIHVVGCVFEGSGDKGISVGERSLALVSDCTIRRCSIGIEVKDASEVVVRNSTLIGNRVTYHSYRKKWLYPTGGRGLLMDTAISGADSGPIDVESQCRLWLLRSPAEVAGEAPRVQHIDRYSGSPTDWKSLIERLATL